MVINWELKRQAASGKRRVGILHDVKRRVYCRESIGRILRKGNPSMALLEEPIKDVPPVKNFIDGE